MSKKKRTKRYQGEDAAAAAPKVVHHYTAVQRSPLHEWWFTNKKRLRLIAIATAVAVVILWLGFELVRAVFFH
jgi:hypothetical protein